MTILALSEGFDLLIYLLICLIQIYLVVWWFFRLRIASGFCWNGAHRCWNLLVFLMVIVVHFRICLELLHWDFFVIILKLLFSELSRFPFEFWDLLYLWLNLHYYALSCLVNFVFLISLSLLKILIKTFCIVDVPLPNTYLWSQRPINTFWEWTHNPLNAHIPLQYYDSWSQELTQRS